MADEEHTDPLVLRLYVAGKTPKSLTAFTNLKKICEEHLQENYTIEVIDLLEKPELAEGVQIIATPTLVHAFPVPVRKVIGDLSDIDKVLFALDMGRK